MPKKVMRVDGSACGHCTMMLLKFAGAKPDEHRITEVHVMGDSLLLPRESTFVQVNCVICLSCGKAVAS